MCMAMILDALCESFITYDFNTHTHTHTHTHLGHFNVKIVCSCKQRNLCMLVNYSIHPDILTINIIVQYTLFTLHMLADTTSIPQHIQLHITNIVANRWQQIYTYHCCG